MDIKLVFKSVGRQIVSGAAVALLVAGAIGAPQALAGIANTKHNLGSAGTGVNKFSGTGEICVFCHTPHGADTSAAVPLWNRTLGDPTTYTTYNSLGTSSLDGATAPVGSVSLACLSCHDGTQAMSAVINAPGSGLSGDANWVAGTWSGANQTGGKINTVANLSKDLSNDHPIGIQYGGGMVAGGQYTKGVIADGGFKDVDFKGVQYANLNGNDVWWVDSGTSAGQRDKADMMLYTRTGSASVKTDGTAGAVLAGSQAFVECASCHDPHVENVAGSNPTFLRKSNASSAVCLACHIK